jgi:hypothetical protein
MSIEKRVKMHVFVNIEQRNATGVGYVLQNFGVTREDFE